MLAVIVVHDRIFPRPFLHAANDFTTFYCAGEVVRERADPYRVEPLRACEQRRGEFGGAINASWEVVPSPFPGYVMALFTVMSLLPYGTAHLAWLAVLLFGVGVATVALTRLTRFPSWAVLAIVGVLVGFWNLDTSEPTPVVAALLACAALCARSGAWRAAGVQVALAMIMPQLALPAFVALLLFAPRARAALVVTAAALGVLSVATLGFAENVEYFTRTLPAQTRAEVWFTYQYSLTHLLALCGVPASAAIRAGQASYLLLIALGVWAAVRLSRVSGDRAVLVLLPPAVASVGGAYSHSVQILAGVGAALMVASLRAVPRALAGLPLVLYSVIWTGVIPWRSLIVATSVSALAAAWLAAGRLSREPVRRLAVALAGWLVLAAAFAALHTLPTQPPDISVAGAPAPAIGPLDQASRIFEYRTELPQFRAFDLRVEMEKLPLVAGALLLVLCAFAARAGTAAGEVSRDQVPLGEATAGEAVSGAGA
ncbi:MAG TPA: glycosyltransferase family 87 protein [Candidatus Elarobacter sp.]|nr:glycosyltransferase family 87 protein [Candidatus Elarobacter sp.]